MLSWSVDTILLTEGGSIRVRVTLIFKRWFRRAMRCTDQRRPRQWKPRVVMMPTLSPLESRVVMVPTLSSLATPEVVVNCVNCRCRRVTTFWCQWFLSIQSSYSFFNVFYQENEHIQCMYLIIEKIVDIDICWLVLLTLLRWKWIYIDIF